MFYLSDVTRKPHHTKCSLSLSSISPSLFVIQSPADGRLHSSSVFLFSFLSLLSCSRPYLFPFSPSIFPASDCGGSSWQALAVITPPPALSCQTLTTSILRLHRFTSPPTLPSSILSPSRVHLRYPLLGFAFSSSCPSSSIRACLL